MSVSRPPTVHTNPAGTVLALRQRRLRHILWIVMFALTAVMALSFSKRGLSLTVGLELLALAMMGLSLWWNGHGQTARAVRLMLLTLVLSLLALMAIGEGLFDEALLAYPAILVFASIFSTRRVFVVLTACMLVSLVLLYALHQSGPLAQMGMQVDVQRLGMLLAILGVTGFFVWLLAGDLHRAMVQLEEEKQALLESHARIEVLAQRDTLTQLPNRSLAKDRLEQLLLRRRQGHGAADGMVGVLFLDLDNFKTVNDSLGHATGDELLCQVADRLGASLHPADTLARLSGDEFLLLLGDVRSEEAVTASATELMRLLGQPFALQGLNVSVTASLGIALAPRDGDEVGVLLKHADLAMYRAKDAGRNAFRFFDASMNESVIEHLHLASGLRVALAQQELQLHYQPQYDLASGRIVGAEALLRWTHPHMGPIPPGKFIPVAERSGLIHEIGAWVLRQACLDAQAWRAQGLGGLSVAVNVSPLQFHRDSIEREVAQALASSGLPAQALELEITESLLLADAQHVSEVLQRLHAQGVQIAIDDFGTGYSNLGYLRRFAVHRLKIDQSFVRKMLGNSSDEGLVRAIIEMAHCLELQVVAEGVEDGDMLQRLQGFECEYGQGYHWSPALPMAGFIEFVRRNQESV